MGELRSAMVAATAAGEEVALLLKSAEVVLGQCNAEIKAFSAKPQDQQAGALRRLAANFSRRISAFVELVHIASGVAGTACADLKLVAKRAQQTHDSEPNAEQLLVASERTIRVLELAEQSVVVMEEKMATAVEELQDAALRRDAAPETVAVVEQLLLRLGRRGTSP